MYRFFRTNREAIKKYLLIFFLSIVSIGMVITLAPIPTGDTSRAESNVLASFGRLHVTTQDLQQAIQNRFRGSPVGYDARLVPALAGSVLDDMVLQQALIQQAGKMGLEVTDQELSQALQAIPWLYPNGTFIGMSHYQDAIYQQTGMSVPQFENQLRTSVLLEKLRDVVTDGVRVSPAQVHAEFLQRNTTAKIEYVVFDPSQFLKAVEVKPQQLEAYFKKDPSRYKIPEEREVKYVLIDPDRVRAGLNLDDNQLRLYYAQHLSDYRVPDRVKVAHILFKTTGKSPAEVTAIEKTAHDVLAQIKAGGDFAALAKKYSEDTSAANGGEIGWIVRGQTVKEFEDAAFSMKPGQTSDLIQTSYGIHIIKVLDKQTAHLQTFDEVKASIRAELERQRLADAQQKLANDFAAEAKKTSFDAAAKKLGLEVKQTPLFRYNQAVPDLGNSDSFENLSFQLRVGEVGQPISVQKGIAVIQLTQIVPEHVPSLDEVRARVEEDYRADQSKVLAAEKAKEFAGKVKRGDFKKVAREMKLEVKESKDFTQQGYVEGLGSGTALAAAFTLKVGQTSDVISLGGNSAVFRVLSHTPANEADFAAQRERLAEELRDGNRSLAFEIYRENLKRQLMLSGQMKINQAALKQFIAAYQHQ
jgi:peptidyl-prolyl cis-trans isomerase D